MECNMKFCQSCGMPLEDENLLGKNADGTSNSDYCMYCYEGGKFKYDVTMEEMIAICIPHMVDANQGMSEEEARASLKSFLPNLKRWHVG